ncbi:Minus-end-directed kinesin ATPase [Handroanthus impetiginosus]|uniref:Minus-end-directed kinesin ATPase n=1 Tax=Handroanthus impetiginosus TaxID=429701 RepID=A0A2G9H6G9_9LAMI|nr:Minus-end-directed kinesin ATPase [Handroanthus impetiginosus]
MFVHINPEINALGETISTLKFAERVATIDLGAAQSNKETCEVRELKEEVSSLKTILERKEAELEQLKSRTNIRGTASPLRMPKHNNNASLKPEINEKHVDTQNTEVRSCSAGRQRRPRLPSKFTDKDATPKMPLLPEDKSLGSINPRFPSPPVRRSISTDRGALMKSRTKSDAPENPPVMKAPFPASVSVNKSVAILPGVMPSTVNIRLNQGASQEPPFPDALNSLQRVTFRKALPENEEEQFKQAPSIRLGGIRKTKLESKAKTKNQSAKIQTSDDAEMLLSDMDIGKVFEEAQKTDYGTIKMKNLYRNSQIVDPREPTQMVFEDAQKTDYGTIKMKNLYRNSQIVEPREPTQMVDPFSNGYQENKLSNVIYQNGKEAGNSSLPDFRRSRSIPRGKLII